MTKILAIGNSFSQDATNYLHDMAKCGGKETKVVNLLIPGCSLKTHWEMVESQHPGYVYELNGKDTGRMLSVGEALAEEDWDFVTLQQASHDSGFIETYFPYIVKLSDYVRQCVPGAKQLIHQTWAYEHGSTHEAFPKYECSQARMYEALKQAYGEVAGTLGLEQIPCGEVIQRIRGEKGFVVLNGGQSLCRDRFHMDLIYGRYATAAVWYEKLLRGNCLENAFVPPTTGETKVELALLDTIKQVVHSFFIGKTSDSL